MQKAFVYILRDTGGKYYIGSTTDMSRRIKQHLQGHTQTTHRMKSPKLVLCQEYATITDARKVELKIKDLKRKTISKK